MKYCESCKVKVDMPVDNCPLCYAQLTPIGGESENSPYPPLGRELFRYHLILRICIFISAAAALLCLVINLLTFRDLLWSAVVAVCIAYMWIVWHTARRLLRKKAHISHIGFNITLQSVFVSLFLIAIDLLISRTGWPVVYVIPFLMIAAILALSTLTLVYKSQVQNFLLYLILSCVIGLVPLALALLFHSPVLWPSISCALYAVVTLLGVFIFADKDAKNQMNKRFHS